MQKRVEISLQGGVACSAGIGNAIEGNTNARIITKIVEIIAGFGKTAGIGIQGWISDLNITNFSIKIHSRDKFILKKPNRAENFAYAPVIHNL